MPEPDLSVGIDVGATKIMMGVVDDSGHVLRSVGVDPWLYPALEDNIENMLVSLEELISAYDRSRLNDIGVGLPGTVDEERGVVVYTPNLRWNDLPLAGILRDRVGLDVHLIQDTAAAAWGEYLFGAGVGLNNVVCVTIGSGVACGVIIEGRLYGGARHTAGEIGHIRVADESLVCGCGRRGCLEAGGSGLGLVKVFQRDVGRGARTQLPTSGIDARMIFDGAREGDETCRAAIDEMVSYLALGLSAVATVLTPDVLIISGGLSREQELLVTPLTERIYEVSYRTVIENVRITPAVLGSDAPLVGAAALHRAPGYGGRAMTSRT